jgi:hypothetical protein
MEVHYGANGQWTSPRTFTGGVDCNNTVFGDPISGVKKWCEIRAVTTTTSSSTQSATIAAPSSTQEATIAAPSNTQLPTISGKAELGKRLTASTGTWSGSPTSFAYKWSRCDVNGANCVLISGTGATASIYDPVSDDIGHTLRVTVTATNAGGSSFATSLATVVVNKVV